MGHGASEWNAYLDPIGLILLGKLERETYFCTPQNSITFAITGGNGVHYGLLDIGEGYSDSSPVVMTVPMSDTHNTIVGGNLVDFLCLGCRQGYLSLDELVHSRDKTLRLLDSCVFNEYADTREMQLFDALTKEFDLSPWDDHAARLTELDEAFSGLVDAKSYPD